MSANYISQKYTQYGTNGSTLNGILGQIGSAVGDVSSKTFEEVAWFSQAISAVESGSAEQIVNTAQNLIMNGFTKIFGGGGNAAKTEAIEKVKPGNKQEEQLVQYM